MPSRAKPSDPLAAYRGTGEIDPVKYEKLTITIRADQKAWCRTYGVKPSLVLRAALDVLIKSVRKP